ncbi:SMI1/KNR4 family protein [bacterium]|nr:SMI1/KNR4 family protein [bacterium]
MSYESIAQRIEILSGVKLAPAKPEDIEYLESIHMPPELVDFYRSYEPQTYAEIESVCLDPVREIREEIADYVPCCEIFPLGYLFFASTEYGDAFCIDSNVIDDAGRSPVVLMTHETDFEGMSSEEAARHRKESADNFEDFLNRFVEGTLDIEPYFPD